MKSRTKSEPASDAAAITIPVAGRQMRPNAFFGAMKADQDSADGEGATLDPLSTDEATAAQVVAAHGVIQKGFRLAEAGELEAALEVMRQALDLYVVAVGVDSDDAIFSLVSIGEVLAELGDNAAAVRTFAHAAAAVRRVLYWKPDIYDVRPFAIEKRLKDAFDAGTSLQTIDETDRLSYLGH